MVYLLVHMKYGYNNCFTDLACSNVCINSVYVQLIDLFPQYGLFFLLFTQLVIFYWMLEIINFTLLSDGCFCTSIYSWALFLGAIYLPKSHLILLHLIFKFFFFFFIWDQEKRKVKSLSSVRLFTTPWTGGHQAPPSMGFPRQEYWSGLLFPSPGDLPDPGIKPGSPALQADALTSEPPGKSKAELNSGLKTPGILHNAPWILRIFQSSLWEQTLSLPFCEQQAFVQLI